jgi:DNA adenine methylase
MTAPFLKWAGGKRWLMQAGLPRPHGFERYVEPFLGGGAIFFGLRPERALLSDINPALIELYEVMRDMPDALRKCMEAHHRQHNHDHYYEVRAQRPESRVDRAARTLYLNRTCWNGLYRVNRRGEFNVPIGTKTAVVMPDDDFGAISTLLKQVDIICCDFELTIDQTKAGDFLFVDPPYTVKHNMNGFVKYNECIFTWADQVRLRDAVSRAANRGAAVVVTNADHTSIIELYDKVAEYKSVPRSSVLAGPADRRGKTTEALFIANC